jgi:DHA1 family inner membrane transport protein
VILGWLVPPDGSTGHAPARIAEELKTLRNPQVQLGLAMTVLSFGGLFAVFTYIQPILAQVTGFGPAAISSVLVVFGVGFSIGNLAGGRLADHNLNLALSATLGALLVVFLGMVLGIHDKIAATILAGLLGAAAFATVAPLQLKVLDAAGAADGTLASSLNIAAFNLGNALGAWAGGVAIAHRGGLSSLPWIGAAFAAAGLVLALLSTTRARRLWRQHA